MSSTLITVEGEIVPVSGEELFFALWLDRRQFWQVSGVIYRSAVEAQTNLAAFNPVRIVVVKIPTRSLLEPPELNALS